MKTVAGIMLFVLGADAAVTAVILHAWQPAALWFAITIPAVAFASRGRIAQTMADRAGWKLGAATELSNPDRPRRVAQAVLSWDMLDLGLIAIGAPGSGKTDSVMLGHIDALRRRRPHGGWAFFDGKGDVDTYRKCVGMDRTPDHFFSSELPGSESVNLLEGAPHDVIDRLSKVLIGTTDSTSFYMDEQRAVLARMVPLLRRLPVATSLRDLYVALSMKDAGNELLRRARSAGADPAEITLARQWLDQPFATRTRNISGLLNRLFIFVAGPCADRLNAYAPDIRINALVGGGESLFVHLPLTAFARDVAIALIEMFGVEARRRQIERIGMPDSYALLFDDWGAFFHEGFGPFSARCRSARMPLAFGFQSHAQLLAIGAGYADELDDTVATKMILRVQGEGTARYAAHLLGQHDALDLGTRRWPGGAGVSLQFTRRYRVNERMLREMQPGEAYVSTLERGPEGIRNPLWRLRLALPEFGPWKNVALPAARRAGTAAGLDFWSRYMNPRALAEFHRSVAREHAQLDAAAAIRCSDARCEQFGDWDANPGLDPERQT